MSKIGILAYGSLIEDPGFELGPLISERVSDVETPFSIEFSRSSKTRDEAPTVVPVDGLGAPVNAVILVLNEEVDIGLAKDLLWRRETPIMAQYEAEILYSVGATSLQDALKLLQIPTLLVGVADEVPGPESD